MSHNDFEPSNCEWCDDEFDPIAAQENGNYSRDDMCIDCQDCANQCVNCNILISDDDSNWSECDAICQSCTNRYYTYCGNCGEYWRDDAVCSHLEENYDDFRDDDDATIHDYSYQPTLKWFVKDIETNTIVKTNRTDFISSNPFMGFELEVEANNNRYGIAEKLLQEINDWAYLKHDGSLDNGFEIVSHPHTLNAYNLRNWNWIQWLTNQDVSSWDTNTCGLHVHINKSAFQNTGHIWRFTNLVLYNRNEAARLAGRRDSRWASFSREYKQVGNILKGTQSPERYTAVNLSPYRTIEVRMFRGSLHEPRVRAALEFVNANFEYTKPLTSHDVLKNDAMSWWSFTSWVKSNESNYPHLNHYLTKIKERAKVDVSTVL